MAQLVLYIWRAQQNIGLRVLAVLLATFTSLPLVELLPYSRKLLESMLSLSSFSPSDQEKAFDFERPPDSAIGPMSP